MMRETVSNDEEMLLEVVVKDGNNFDGGTISFDQGCSVLPLCYEWCNVLHV